MAPRQPGDGTTKLRTFSPSQPRCLGSDLACTQHPRGWDRDCCYGQGPLGFLPTVGSSPCRLRAARLGAEICLNCGIGAQRPPQTCRAPVPAPSLLWRACGRRLQAGSWDSEREAQAPSEVGQGEGRHPEPFRGCRAHGPFLRVPQGLGTEGVAGAKAVSTPGLRPPQAPRAAGVTRGPGSGCEHGIPSSWLTHRELRFWGPSPGPTLACAQGSGSEDAPLTAAVGQNLRRFWSQKRSCLVTCVAVLSPICLVTRSPCALTTAAATTASCDWACGVKGDPPGLPKDRAPRPPQAHRKLLSGGNRAWKPSKAKGWGTPGAGSGWAPAMYTQAGPWGSTTRGSLAVGCLC